MIAFYESPYSNTTLHWQTVYQGTGTYAPPQHQIVVYQSPPQYSSSVPVEFYPRSRELVELARLIREFGEVLGRSRWQARKRSHEVLAQISREPVRGKVQPVLTKPLTFEPSRFVHQQRCPGRRGISRSCSKSKRSRSSGVEA